MAHQKDLEERVNSFEYRKQNSKLRNYLVNTTASWLYWTPIMTATECISGLELDEVINSRLTSLVIGAVVAHPHGLFRKYWSDALNITPQSRQFSKYIADTTATWCFQIPLYSLQLYCSGTSFKEGLTAFGIGLAASAILGRPYGIFQDSWRKLWGTKPVF